MKRMLLALVAVAGLTLTTAAGCIPAYRSPCLDLSAPTEPEKAAVLAGAEVERETEGVDCELRDGTWQEEEETS